MTFETIYERKDNPRKTFAGQREDRNGQGKEVDDKNLTRKKEKETYLGATPPLHSDNTLASEEVEPHGTPARRSRKAESEVGRDRQPGSEVSVPSGAGCAGLVWSRLTCLDSLFHGAEKEDLCLF